MSNAKQERRETRIRVETYLNAMGEVSKAFGELTLDKFSEDTWKSFCALNVNLAKLAADEARKLED